MNFDVIFELDPSELLLVLFHMVYFLLFLNPFPFFALLNFYTLSSFIRFISSLWLQEYFLLDHWASRWVTVRYVIGLVKAIYLNQQLLRWFIRWISHFWVIYENLWHLILIESDYWHWLLFWNFLPASGHGIEIHLLGTWWAIVEIIFILLFLFSLLLLLLFSFPLLFPLNFSVFHFLLPSLFFHFLLMSFLRFFDFSALFLIFWLLAQHALNWIGLMLDYTGWEL